MRTGPVPMLVQKKVLRAGLRPEEAADVMAMLTSPSVYHQLVVRQGWSAPRFRRWMTTTLLEQLLKSKPQRWCDWPASDAAGYDIDDEWLLGDSLLAAPLVTEAPNRDVHVPPGRWHDVTRSREAVGPTTLRGYSAGLDETPVFVRLGRPGTGALLRAVAHW
jgi:hypothetical protein